MLISLIMFSWPLSSYKNITSRKVRWESVTLWKASNTFFIATTCFDFLSIAFKANKYFPNYSVSPFSKFLDYF